MWASLDVLRGPLFNDLANSTSKSTSLALKLGVEAFAIFEARISFFLFLMFNALL